MFKEHTKHSITYYTAETLSGVTHAFSTRTGGVSPAPWDSLNLGISRGDEKERVQENYRRFCGAVGVDAARTVLSQQVHEDTVRLVTEDDAGKGLWRARDYSAVDGLITQTPHLPLVVFSADCNVILFYDPVRRAVGACHAGWRGTVKNIAGKTVQAMVEHFGCRSTDIRAAIGPSIGPCCFETDGDVPAALYEVLGVEAAPYIRRQGAKFHIDLKAVNALWLLKAGVEHIDMSAQCTYCLGDSLYWSHRRVGNARGAQVAMISLEETE